MPIKVGKVTKLSNNIVKTSSIHVTDQKSTQANSDDSLKLEQTYDQTNFQEAGGGISDLYNKDIKVQNAGIPNTTSETFTINTGLSQDTPTIIISSEFLPIKGSINSSERDYALNVKEKSIILTAKNSITVLTKNEETKKLVESNKKKLVDFAKSQTDRTTILLKSLTEAIGALDVKNFSHIAKPYFIPSNKAQAGSGSPNEGAGSGIGLSGMISSANPNNNIKILSSKAVSQVLADSFQGFESYLRDIGWGDQTKKLSPTVLYQQFILETKRALLTHTPYLNNSISSLPLLQGEYDETYKLRGLFSINSNGVLVPQTKSDLTDPGLLFKRVYLKKQDTLTLESIAQLTVVDLANAINGDQYSNDPITLASLDDNFAINSDGSINSNIETIATLFSKFVVFSRGLKNSTIQQDLSTLNYAVNLAEGSTNYEVWNSLIGPKFLRDSLDLSFASNQLAGTTTGIVNPDPSLLGLSRSKNTVTSEDNKSKEYSVLTFETSDMPLINDSQYGLTHGSFFYIDSALSTNNLEKFDTSRLDFLLSSLKQSKESIKLIKQIYSGTPGSGEKDIYKMLDERSSEVDDPIDNLLNALQPLINAYQSFLTIDAAGNVAVDSQLRKDALYLKDQGIPWQSWFVLPAAIFKFAKLHRKLALVLFQILVREAYKKSFPGTSVNYLPFTSEFKVKTIGKGFKKDEPPAETQLAISTEYGSPGGIGSNYFWSDSNEYARALYTGDVEANTPELILDAILLEKSQKLNVKSIDDSQGGIPKYIPVTSTARVKGFDQNIADLVDDPVFRALFLEGNPFVKNFGTGLDGNVEGLFKIVVELMTNLFQSDIFKSTVTKSSSTNTVYGNQTSMGMLWTYFNLIIEMISMITPDTFQGFFTAASGDVKIGGYSLDLQANQLQDYFSVLSDGKTIYPKQLDNFAKSYYSESTRVANWIDLLDKFVSNASLKLSSFKTSLSQNFLQYLTATRDIFNKDTMLSPEQRLSLANLSFSREQIVLAEHIMTELIDRFDSSNDSESKLKTFPDFLDFPDKFINYCPVNDIDLISYTSLSQLFKNLDEFSNFKGNNKRILSVGLPPRMLRNLIGSPAGISLSKEENLRRNVVRLCVYKNDVLNPGIVFKPKTFLFEVNRFPTRIVSNWGNLNGFKNFFDAPTKYFDGKKILLHKNFNEAFSNYGNFLNQEERAQIYLNHVFSFVLEEYVKWFTGSSIDESRYYNYSGLDEELKNISIQYDNYIKTTGGKFDATNLFGSNPPDINNLDLIVENLQASVKSYLKNETLLLDTDSYVKKILYPKKFDRTFNIMFDPDDFEIATAEWSSGYAAKYVDQGLLKIVKGGGPTAVYKWNRQTQQSDIYMDEYWITVEPYDIS